MRIALLFNAKPAETPPQYPDDAFEEYDSIDTVEDIAGALRGLGVHVDHVLADRGLPRRLEEGRYDFAFNIAEGPVMPARPARSCREAIVPAICELMELPYTGSDPLTLAVTLDKAMARRAVSCEVPVAQAVLIGDGPVESQIEHLHFPVIVKPNNEGSSKGIRRDSVAGNGSEAAKCVAGLREHYGCPVLVEEFLAGPEITVAIAGNPPGERILGVMEITAANDCGPFVYSLEMKRAWRTQVAYFVPPRLPRPAVDHLSDLALKAYRLLGCRDIARVDFRLDADGRPHFLECNPLPGLNRESGDIVIMTRESLGYETLVQGILQDAARRTGIALR
jgi:D-alanine-D-alanine ligase